MATSVIGEESQRVNKGKKAETKVGAILRAAAHLGGRVAVFYDSLGVVLSADTPAKHAIHARKKILGVYTQDCPPEYIIADLECCRLVEF